MQARYLVAALMLAAVAGCARTTQVESTVGVVPEVVPPDARTLPAGTRLEVSLDQTVGTKRSRVGDRFTAHVESAVVALNGETVVPAGAVVVGTVTGLQESSNVNDPALIRLDFNTLRFGGASYPFAAAIERTGSAQTSGDNTLRNAAIGAAAGAVIGAVMGKSDTRDIIIGAAIGAAAGTLVSLGTDEVNAKLPSGTRMTLRSSQTIALRYVGD